MPSAVGETWVGTARGSPSHPSHAPITPDGVAATRHREDDKCRLPWTWRGCNLVAAVKTHNAAPPRETVWQHPGR